MSKQIRTDIQRIRPSSTVPTGQNAKNATVSHEIIPHTEHRQLETPLANGTKMLTSNILNISCQYISNTNVKRLSIMSDYSIIKSVLSVNRL